MKIQLETPELVIFESALFRTTSTLLIGKDYLLLIDPNWLPNEVEFIRNYIDRIRANKTCYLLFTHSDYDHIIGYGRFKDFTTIASQNFIKNPLKDSCLQQIIKFDDEYYIKRNYDIEYPDIDIVINGENVVKKIGSDEFVFNQAVGHNADGLITFNRSKKVLIVGDYLSNIEFPYIYTSVKKYELVLNLLEKKFLSEENIILITGHGDYTNKRQEMLLRVKESRDYIQQLKQVVEQEEEFDLGKLFERYDFPIGMKAFHLGNIKLARKENKEI